VRILLSSPGLIGHIHPLVPLAAALRDRGNDVRWATGPDGCERVRRAGFDAVAAGLAQGERWREFGRMHPEIDELPPHERPDVMFGKLFGEISAPAALADLLPVARAWRPDLIVNDAAELAGPIVAAAIGVPHVTHAFGALVPEVRTRRAGDEVAPLWAARGLEPRPYGGLYDHLYVDIYPPSLQPPGGGHVGARQLLRPVPYGGATAAEAVAGMDRLGRPLVYLTFGTVFNNNHAFRAALAGVRDLDVGLVVTVGPDGDPEAFGPQPPNVLVARYIPQTALLPACDLVVSHGGSGTVLGALTLGIPQLCLPQAADQFLNAAALVRTGAGIAIPPGDVNATVVAEAIGRLLDDGGFRANARMLADEIAAMPSHDDVAAVLESLA
jgi:UDP:flavonoid glycosyltransferase YjiC (YdhE family)